MDEQVVTLAYLEEMRANLVKQAEQHYANWQATLGAIDLLQHLMDVAKAGQPANGAAGQRGGAATGDSGG